MLFFLFAYFPIMDDRQGLWYRSLWNIETAQTRKQCLSFLQERVSGKFSCSGLFCATKPMGSLAAHRSPCLSQRLWKWCGVIFRMTPQHDAKPYLDMFEGTALINVWLAEE